MSRMSEAFVASEEIERTLRLERDEVERRIAQYRVWLFGLLFAATPVFALIIRLRGSFKASPAPPLILYGCLLAYALLLRRLVERRGAAPWLVHASLLLDLAALTLPPKVISLFDPGYAARSQLFASHLAAPAMLVVLFVNVLRMSASAALVGSAAAIVGVLFVLLPLEGLQPPLFGLCALLAFTAVIGRAAARRARLSLETFARLHLLRRYLPTAAVDRVLREDPDAALSIGGRLATVTLLSADLRNFTRMSENLSPGEVVRQINAYHARMLEEIERHGGALDKFIGDGILAVFGLPGEQADSGAQGAVACAAAMPRALEGLNEERAREGLPPLAMGIGVHTGPVVAGNIGVPGRRLEFTVIGDAVNTASRLEGLTKEAGRPVLVSHETIARLKACADLEELAPMRVRGREASLRVFAFKSHAR